MLYLWIKAFHLIAVIAWMAGMLYLPRLFVYHCEAEPGSKQSETFKVMERRLLPPIITPGLVGGWGRGLWLPPGGGAGPVARLGGELAHLRLAASQSRPGPHAVRPAWLFPRLRARFCR